ncbi:hypothetical protein FRC11_002101, partial [Ceratobasidium sp. 423]
MTTHFARPKPSALPANLSPRFVIIWRGDSEGPRVHGLCDHLGGNDAFTFFGEIGIPSGQVYTGGCGLVASE